MLNSDKDYLVAQQYLFGHSQYCCKRSFFDIKKGLYPKGMPFSIFIATLKN